jgi:hypothetical protein
MFDKLLGCFFTGVGVDGRSLMFSGIRDESVRGLAKSWLDREL